MKNKISVIIPAYNEENSIGECLESLKNQSLRDFEVIIVDDGSKDQTPKIINEYSSRDKRFKMILGEHKGAGYSRNLGAKSANGDILVFVDADMTFDKNYLKFLIAPIISGKSSIGTEERFQKANNLEKPISRFWGAYVSGDRRSHSSKGIVFRAIKKKKFFELGMFDPSLGYADDQTFLIKYKLVPDLADNAICYHKNPESLKEVFSQSIWIGSSLANSRMYLSNRLLSPIILIFLIFFFLPFVAFIFLKKTFSSSYPRNLFEFFLLIVFAFYRVTGTSLGIIRRNIFGVSYR